MLNLATEKDKRNLQKEYRLRLVTIVLFLFFAITTLGALFLLPSYIILKVRSTSLEEKLVGLQESIVAEGGKEAQEFLAETNRRTTLVDTLTQTLESDVVLAQALGERTRGVHVRSISFGESREGAGAKISVRGTADTRSALVAFRDALAGQEGFENVVLPLKDLASNRNIPFGLTIDVEPYGNE